MNASSDQNADLKIISNDDLFLHALKDATQTYFIKSVEPLLQSMPEKIWQIKRIQLVETPENKMVLEKIKKFSNATLKLMVKSVFNHRIFDGLVDASQFTELKIVTDNNIGEYTGGALAMLDNLNIAIQFYYCDEIIVLEKNTLAYEKKDTLSLVSTYAAPENFHLLMAKRNDVKTIT